DPATLHNLKKARMANGTYSELDEKWPVAEPKTGMAADILEYLLRKRTDAFFWFLRHYKPNLVLGKGGPVFVTRYRDVKEILDNPEVFQVTYRPMMDPSVGPFMLGRDGTVYNERDKGLMRSLIQQRDLPEVRKVVAQLSAECIEDGFSDGQIEIVSRLTRKAPILLNGKYFGFPGPDLPTMMKWSRDTQADMFHNTKMVGKVHDDDIRAGRFMRHYLKSELLPQRRRELKKNPDLDDVVSRLLKLKTPEEIGFTEERMLSNIMGMLVGHIETTSAAIVQALDQLLRRPGALAGAKAAAEAGDDRLLYRYCWEALRFNPVNPIVLRLCVEDYRVASGAWRNTLIKGGSVVLVATRSAMKDEREVEKPRKFRLDRPDHHYMHLGYGMHRCLGDHVSQVQVPEIMKSLILKPNLRRVTEIDYADGPFPERFVVTFDA
ncbi:MAG: cytochrome P450, partial [Rhodothermia bacterium]